MPDLVVDPFGNEIDRSSPIAVLGLCHRINDEGRWSVGSSPPQRGVQSLPPEYWDRICSVAELFRRDLNGRRTLGAHEISAKHLRLSSGDSDRETELETELLDSVDLIAWLCASPHMDLRFETERAPIDRARRVAPDAIPYLASHSEDWLMVTLAGPVPKQIRSQFREDEIAIYENRMVRTLLEGCIEWLHRLDSILREIRDADNDRLELKNLKYHLRFARLGRWLDGDEDESATYLRERSALVEELLRSLERLRGSLLFGGTDGASRVDGLHMTNLLMNDHRYLRMVRLWDVWQNQLQSKMPDENDTDDLARQRARDLGAYLHLLSLRALESLGAIDLATGESTLPDFRLSIEPTGTHGGHTVWFHHVSGQEMKLVVSGVSVGLGDSQDPFDDTGMLHAALTALDTSARGRHELHCLVHTALPNRIADSESGWVRSLSIDAGHAQQSVWTDLEGLIVLPAHPLGVECLEAFGRLHRMIISAIRSRVFPLEIPITGPLLDIPDAAIDVVGTGLKVCDRRLVLVGSEIDRSALIPDRRSRSTSPPRPQDSVDWHDLLEPLERMRSALLHCPRFPAEHDGLPSLDFWDASGFRARCPGCQSVWGIRSCDSCLDRYSYMFVDSDVQWVEAVQTGRPGSYFGMDATAEPCTNDRATFVCPSCFSCPARRTRPECQTCNLQ